MSYTYRQGTLPATTPTVVYTCPSGKTALIQSVRVNNPAAYVFTLNKHDYGDGTTQIYQLTLSAGDTVTDQNPMVLRPNDYLELVSSVVGTNYVLSIIEY